MMALIDTMYNKVKLYLDKLQASIDNVPKYKFNSLRRMRIGSYSTSMLQLQNNNNLEANEEKVIPNNDEYYLKQLCTNSSNNEFDFFNSKAKINNLTGVIKCSEVNNEELSEEDNNLTTAKINEVLDVLKTTEINELLEIYEKGDSGFSSGFNSEEEIRSQKDIKKEVGLNLFSFEIFLLSLLKDLNKYKINLGKIETKFGHTRTQLNRPSIVSM